MSTIRSITTLALALGAAAAPQLVQFTPVQPPKPDVPKVHAPSVTPPAFPTIEPTAPTVPPININKDLILEPALPNVELKGPKVARDLPVKLTPQGLEISVSAPIVVPTAGAGLPALAPREDDFPVDLNAIQPPKTVLPNVSTPTLSVKLPDVAIPYPKVPKLPRRNIKILPESVIPTQSVDIQAISSIISALGGLVTARNAEPQPANAGVLPRETPEVLSIVSSVVGGIKGPVIARETPAALPIVSSVASVIGDIKASLLPRALPVEVPSTTVDIAAVKTVMAVLKSIIDSRDLATVGVTVPSVTVELPIVSSALSVLSNAAGTGLPIKAARGTLPEVPPAVVAVGVDVPAFTATVPVLVPVAARTAIDLPLSTLIQVPSISKTIELPAVQTPELKGKFTAGKRTTAGVIGDVQGKIDEILSAVPQ
ncbi:hypothetical protein K4K58_009176 [Colletotrichum sp. SAR11_239]|nr:hypothetical protein K4K58_009176 [Colletotrichum sp. SAR11_239]